MRIIVGLGNPGTRYRCTKHNVGFRCIDLLARRWGIRLSERRAKAVLGRGRHLDEDIVLAKPRTFMNHSGEGVEYLVSRFGVNPTELVIVYDDIHLPVGRLRMRPRGSDGGHNGIRSIIASLKTQEFPRVRVGIGQPASAQEQVSHVLGRFGDDEAPLVARSVKRVVQALDCLLEENIDVAMNYYNRDV